MLPQVQPKSFKVSIKVAVRVRPKRKKEESDKEKSVIFIDGNNIRIIPSIGGSTHAFTCDYCFPPNDLVSVVAQNKHQQQKEVYECVAKPLLLQGFKQYNTCLFAYGQTGTGKSYSMMGSVGSNSELVCASGIVPRFCQDLFIHINELKNSATSVAGLSFEIQISYFEIYNEQIRDLLGSSLGSLSVREHPKLGPYVVNLTKCLVTSFEEVQRWLAVGNRKRVVASTLQNKRSSRSHVIFTIMLTQKSDDRPSRSATHMNFIDLAGNEGLASISTTGVRRQESLAINLSLFALGKVITALAEKNLAPYRESVLTWLLKESLGGNSKTVMLATVSPCAAHLGSTLSTLRYSCLVGKIVNTARICDDPKPCLPSVKPEVEFKKHCFWEAKVAEAELKCAEAKETLALYGLSSLSDPHKPHLVNISQDPLLSQTMFFPIHPGPNWVGPMVCSNVCPDIQLTGLMIEENHCCIDHSADLKITANAETYVNGHLIGQSEVLLRHGDRIVFGGSHFFHLHFPRDSQFNEKYANDEVVDFETSYHELREVQEETLKIIIKDAQEKERLQKISEIKELRQEAASELAFQRHFNENEVSFINRDLQERQHIPPLSSTTKSDDWQGIELLLQDTQRQLEQPPTNSLLQTESSFVIQSMLNEANAICRHFQQRYTFSRKEVVTEDLLSAICVHDHNRGLMMHWSFDTMKQRLKTLRVAVEEESDTFPIEDIFNSGDVWYQEDDASSFFAPNTRAKLEGLLTSLNKSSIISNDGSKFKANSPKRSSLLPRSVVDISAETDTACRELLRKLRLDRGSISNFYDVASSFQSLLDHPDRTISFAIELNVISLTTLSILPGLVDFMFTKREVLSCLRNEWLKSIEETGNRLKISLEFVMQSVKLDSSGLFDDWILSLKNTFKDILVAYCELCVVFCTDSTHLKFVSTSTALIGFTAAHKRVRDSTIVMCEEIRASIEQLPKRESPNPSLTNNGCPVTNACYDCVHHIVDLLEELRSTIEDVNSLTSDDMQLGDLHLKFNQRVDLLLHLGKDVEQLFVHLKTQDLSQLETCVTVIQERAVDYTSLMGVTSDSPFLCGLTYSILTVHRLVGEKKRKTGLQKGRNLVYSPIPPQMLVTPPTKAQSKRKHV